ncbi:ribbon-helix-helix domain-containing protein [Anaerotruncus massiliensis (ex Liu et al. 2021)]|uniref:ribbon-helix-helix domain-containing protein n=2 Tax=Anaerotruncus TaxID=244127 RepID=UPI003AB8EA94
MFMGSEDLKYRKRLSTSVDSGLYKAIYNYSVDTKIPLSRLMDDAIEAFLKAHEISYEIAAPYKKEKIK